MRVDLYCTLADQTEEAAFRAQRAQILASFKLGVLVGSKTYVSATHAIESDDTFELLRHAPRLLDTGFIVIGLREGPSTLRDYAATRYRTEARGALFIDRATELDQIGARFVRWSAPQQQQEFKRQFLQALENPQSILRRNLRGAKGSAVATFHSTLADLPPEHVTRRRILELSREHLSRPQRTPSVMREANALYYAVGSFDKNLIPDVAGGHMADFIDAAETTRCPISIAATDDLFGALCHVQALPTDILSRLSVDSLIDLRLKYTAHVEAFAELWWRLVIQAGSPGTRGLSDRARAFTELCREQMHREERRVHGYKRATQAVAVASFAIGAAASGSSTTLSALNFVLGALGLATTSDAVAARITRAHFCVLSTHLRKLARGASIGA